MDIFVSESTPSTVLCCLRYLHVKCFLRTLGNVYDIEQARYIETIG
jgi:hypothetical protein